MIERRRRRKAQQRYIQLISEKFHGTHTHTHTHRVFLFHKHFNLIEWPNVSRILHKMLFMKNKILNVNKDKKQKVLQILLFFLLLLLSNQKKREEWPLGCQLFHKILIFALFIEQMPNAIVVCNYCRNMYVDHGVN